MIWQEQVYAKYLGKSILLDSNLLLVLLIGNFSVHWLRRFKRVNQYTIRDYTLLVRFVGGFSVLLTTPHILAEVSNLANGLPEAIRKDFFRSFSMLLQSTDGAVRLHEQWIAADKLAALPEFIPFGITDAALKACAPKALILTEDHRLSGVLAQRGADVINFRDLLGLEHRIRGKRS